MARNYPRNQARRRHTREVVLEIKEDRFMTAYDHAYGKADGPRAAPHKHPDALKLPLLPGYMSKEVAAKGEAVKRAARERTKDPGAGEWWNWGGTQQPDLVGRRPDRKARAAERRLRMEREEGEAGEHSPRGAFPLPNLPPLPAATRKHPNCGPIHGEVRSPAPSGTPTRPDLGQRAEQDRWGGGGGGGGQEALQEYPDRGYRSRDAGDFEVGRQAAPLSSPKRVAIGSEPRPKPEFKPGALVETQKGGGLAQSQSWYPAQVVAWLKDEGCYAILFSDGDRDLAVPPQCVRRATGSAKKAAEAAFSKPPPQQRQPREDGGGMGRGKPQRRAPRPHPLRKQVKFSSSAGSALGGQHRGLGSGSLGGGGPPRGVGEGGISLRIVEHDKEDLTNRMGNRPTKQEPDSIKNAILSRNKRELQRRILQNQL